MTSLSNSSCKFVRAGLGLALLYLPLARTAFAPGKDGGREGKFNRKANCAEFGKRRGRRSLMLSDAERATLGEIGHRLGRKVLAAVAIVARPDTILAW
jgi:hypothetical protein